MIVFRIPAAVAMLVLLSACSRETPPAPLPPAVSVANPPLKTVVDWDEYIGHFEAPQSVELRARVTGQVTQILFRDGQDVQEGEPLFVLDPQPYKAALDQARASVESAEATRDNAILIEARSATLVAKNAVSKERLETDQTGLRTATAALHAAQAALETAELNYNWTTVRAPVSGRASSRRVSIGDHVQAGTTLLTKVVSLDPIWFVFDGAESFYLKYLRQARQGQRQLSRDFENPIDIRLSDETSFAHRGKMVFVDNAIDVDSGTIQAHAVVDNHDHFLTPGMFGRARLLGSGSYRAMLVPDEVIITKQSQKEVLVLARDDTVTKRTVELGPEVLGLRAVKGGLASTDLVILDRITQLRPGMKVKPHRTAIEPRNADASRAQPPVAAPEPSAATASDGY
ncbi:efflux RND transporter periplasmic adaptor subunit [Bradyrhizobium sp. CER78]|uniref:efflux RND transporter periplasmic adaptor subunit n=1 Tax=Bradyrhizobium sp. CER78 TaxID=3039162 RepID=UPI00244C9DD6|nr:efflux RND transporter periplasmic adaptor subunit [Bradyrhizobium sp. CER78]MDH2380791.1 efflux RND transporter periplasmic adaptor subunit [Bradyrhizobium sp. CER78]